MKIAVCDICGVQQLVNAFRECKPCSEIPDQTPPKVVTYDDLIEDQDKAIASLLEAK